MGKETETGKKRVIAEEKEAEKENDIGYLIRRVHTRLRADADANFQECELTMAQVRVLRAVWIAGGETTQRRIETELHVSHPTVVGLVGRLAKSGYVCCRPDQQDRRNKIVAITQRAIDQREWQERKVRETEARLTVGFTEDELAHLRAMLQRLYANLE